MTITELIARLQHASDTIGPDTRVVIGGDPLFVRPIRSTSTAAVGKADRTKLVSRSGIPVFVLKG